MKLLPLVIWAMLFASCLNAQSFLSGQTIATTSGFTSENGNNLMLTWTLGQVADETRSSSGFIIAEGIESYKKLLTGNDYVPLKEVGISIYPNPTRGILKIEFSEIIPDKMILTDLNGKQLKAWVPESSLELDFRNLANGMYFLTFFDYRNNKFSTAKIQKVR
jgi:hypothetical protein